MRPGPGEGLEPVGDQDGVQEHHDPEEGGAGAGALPRLPRAGQDQETGATQRAQAGDGGNVSGAGLGLRGIARQNKK